MEPSPNIQAIDESGVYIDVEVSNEKVLRNAVCFVSAFARPFNVSGKCGVGLVVEVVESIFVLGHGQVNSRLTAMESPHAARWKDLLLKRSSPSKEHEADNKKAKKSDYEIMRLYKPKDEYI